MMQEEKTVRRITTVRSPHLASFAGMALSLATASCALVFPDSELEGGASTNAGGAGGSVSDGAGGAAFLADGEECSSNVECVNGHCLPSNTEDGNVCCATDCPDMGAASCATNGKCDILGGSCALYDAGTPCGDDATCDAGMHSSMQCQMGACEVVSSPCPDGLTCQDETACKVECATSADCVSPEAECPAGECVQPVGSACASNDQCMSGICGTEGVGHCCTAACDPVGDPCGAIDCDTSGACVFPETACGATASCSNATLTSDYCDGMGACGRARQTEPCPGNLVCEDADSCFAMCGSNDTTGDARCRQGNWCDGTACQPSSIVPGFPCSRGAQCASGICTAIGCYL